MKLIGSLASPYVRKVRVVMAEKKLDYQFESEDVWASDAILARLEANWPGRTAEQRSQAWIDRQMKKIDAALEAMSTGLAEKPWCTGIHMTLADIAVGCALGYLAFRFPQIAWRERKNLARLADKMNARPSFIDTAPPTS